MSYFGAKMGYFWAKMDVISLFLGCFRPFLGCKTVPTVSLVSVEHLVVTQPVFPLANGRPPSLSLRDKEGMEEIYIFLKTTIPLWPPKPKVLLMATFTLCWMEWLGTRFK